MLINKLLKFFYKKEQSQKPIEDNYNSIRFLIDNNGKTYIKIKLGNLSSESAEQFGYLLYLLNEGYYTQTILDCCTDLSKQDQNHAQFVKKIIEVWSTEILENDPDSYGSDNDPVIRPTQFNIGK